jgi:Ca2+-binding RTX toxin-like protein
MAFAPTTTATYHFETITAAQALAISSGDNILFDGGPASSATVSYVAATATVPELISVTYAGRTVLFATTVTTVSFSANLIFGDGSTLLVGSAADEILADNLQNAGIFANSDALFGGAGNDGLLGFNGNDVIQGNQGNDVIDGGNGNDTIFGGQDNDTILTGTGVNWVNGNRGNDDITGGNGNDLLLGGRDNDTIVGGGGVDVLNGNLGNDSIQGGSKADSLLGETGNDTLSGSEGNDALAGGAVITAAECAGLKSLAEQPEIITHADVSRAVRGPRD